MSQSLLSLRLAALKKTLSTKCGHEDIMDWQLRCRDTESSRKEGLTCL